MASKSANSQKCLGPKMFLNGPRNSFWSITSNFICGTQHFDKKSVSHRPIVEYGPFAIFYSPNSVLAYELKLQNLK